MFPWPGEGCAGVLLLSDHQRNPHQPPLSPCLSFSCLSIERDKSQAAGDKILPLSPRPVLRDLISFVTQEVGLPLCQSAWQPWPAQAIPSGGMSGWCRAQKSGVGWQRLKEEHAQFLLTNSPTGQSPLSKAEAEQGHSEKEVRQSCAHAGSQMQFW